NLPRNELAQWCLVLMYFRDSSVLDWIEANVHDPLTGHWGDVAAVSLFDWDRASKWLKAGRPLSLVALDAMVGCSGPHPSQSSLIQKMRPRLRSQVHTSVIEAELLAYASRDRAPRVSNAVRYIMDNLPVIVAAG